MLCIVFMMCGSLCIILPWLMPLGFFMYIVWLGLTVMGIMMCWIGVIMLIMRQVGTRTHLFLPLPRANEVISLHERRGGHATFRRGRVDALEHITMKDMIFKDTGGGTRIAGHRVIKTNETVNHNIPDWTAQYLYQIRKKYMVDAPEQLKRLYEQLKTLRRPIPGLDASSIESQLNLIPELKVLMQDEKQKQTLVNMKLEDLQQMSECLYNGQIIHFEDYEKFQEAASPYDMESYTKRKEVHRLMQANHYKDPMQADWMKYALVIFVLCIAAGIAYAFFTGGK